MDLTRLYELLCDGVVSTAGPPSRAVRSYPWVMHRDGTMIGVLIRRAELRRRVQDSEGVRRASVLVLIARFAPPASLSQSLLWWG
jgi:hypothetical protein